MKYKILALKYTCVYVITYGSLCERTARKKL